MIGQGSSPSSSSAGTTGDGRHAYRAWQALVLDMAITSRDATRQDSSSSIKQWILILFQFILLVESDENLSLEHLVNFWSVVHLHLASEECTGRGRAGAATCQDTLLESGETWSARWGGSGSDRRPTTGRRSVEGWTNRPIGYRSADGPARVRMIRQAFVCLFWWVVRYLWNSPLLYVWTSLGEISSLRGTDQQNWIIKLAYQQIVTAALLHPKFFGKLPKKTISRNSEITNKRLLPWTRAERVIVNSCTCRTCHREAKCRKELWLQARGALWSNYKQTSQVNRTFLCKKYELLLRQPFFGGGGREMKEPGNEVAASLAAQQQGGALHRNREQHSPACGAPAASPSFVGGRGSPADRQSVSAALLGGALVPSDGAGFGVASPPGSAWSPCSGQSATATQVLFSTQGTHNDPPPPNHSPQGGGGRTPWISEGVGAYRWN